MLTSSSPKNPELAQFGRRKDVRKVVEYNELKSVEAIAISLVCRRFYPLCAVAHVGKTLVSIVTPSPR